jgi:hypothetical protein
LSLSRLGRLSPAAPPDAVAGRLWHSYASSSAGI